MFVTFFRFTNLAGKGSSLEALSFTEDEVRYCAALTRYGGKRTPQHPFVWLETWELAPPHRVTGNPGARRFVLAHSLVGSEYWTPDEFNVISGDMIAALAGGA